MKVMVIVKASRDSEAGVMPSEQLLTEMGNYNEELVKAGIMLSGEGLHPSSRGARVRFSGKERSVIDGPFAETKELVAGFWMWKVKSMDEAIEWLKRCPNPHDEMTEVEIRPVFEAEDFGEAFTPELREQEANLRAQTLGLGAIRFEDLPERALAGLNETYTFETRVSIPKQWARFSEHFGKIPGQVGTDSYGVCWNFKPGCGFDYLTSVQVNGSGGLPEGFNTLKLAPQRYAVFTHRGKVTDLPKTLEGIWQQWLPDSGFKPAEVPAFERYTERFDSKTGTGEVEIYVPLEG